MRIILLGTLLFPLLLLAQTDSTGSTLPLVYEGNIASDYSMGEKYERMLGSFKRSFGKQAGTDLSYHSAVTDSLQANSKVNFVQKKLQSKEDTRGIITFDITMYADATGVQYRLYNFYHHGNPQARYGPANFELITLTSAPPRVPGIPYKNRVRIWQEMKDTVDVHMRARIAAFEAQLAVDL